MRLIQIEHNPSRSQLITFGICWLVFIGGAGFILRSKGASEVVLTVTWGVAIGIPLLGMLYREIMRYCYIGLSYLTFPIGFVVSHIVLACVYYLVLTPVGLLMRIFGYDPLARRFEPNARSYWIKRESGTELKRYFRQF